MLGKERGIKGLVIPKAVATVLTASNIMSYANAKAVLQNHAFSPYHPKQMSLGAKNPSI
jgi:hypothetical protein